MKLVIALAVLIFISLPRANAAPSHINNSTQATQTKVQEVVATEVVQPTITSEAPTPAPVPVVETEKLPPTIDVESEAKAFIYFKESGNNPLAKNSIGCFGLGQDCNGIVEQQCGGDYNCQDRFFTEYMLRRYKTWTAAKTFWQSRVPINGRDVGHWW